MARKYNVSVAITTRSGVEYARAEVTAANRHAAQSVLYSQLVRSVGGNSARVKLAGEYHVEPVERPLTPARVYVRDKRTGTLREEIQPKPMQSIRFAIALRERALEAERKADLARLCPKCRQITALNGTCDFCGEYVAGTSAPLPRYKDVTSQITSADFCKRRRYGEIR